VTGRFAILLSGFVGIMGAGVGEGTSVDKKKKYN
jgi:hypothetical protein